MVKELKHKLWNGKAVSGHRRLVIALILVGVFASIGYYLIQQSKAAGFTVTAEAESGVLAGNATLLDPTTGASGNKAVQFKSVPVSTETPAYKTDVILSGRSIIWGVGFLPGTNGGIVFNERKGTVNLFKDGKVTQLAAISDVKAQNEGGLTGLAVDPLFSQNRFIYTCFNTAAGDIKVVRWRVADDLASLQDRRDIITGISVGTSGNHSGCQTAFGPDDNLWIGTGDAKLAGSLPQSPSSLNGKILRVNREGQGVTGNQGGNFDARIFSYGHRNVQGIAFTASPKGGVLGLSIEHGPLVDDEMNELRNGNFGWAPGTPYEDNGPMTDKGRFPDAVEAVWDTPAGTQATSGLAIAKGAQWKGWNGAAVIGVLNREHVKILRLDGANKVTKEERIFEGTYGRLRTVVQGPDGNLYITTSNGSDDKIIRLTPQ